MAQHAWCFPIEPALRLIVDMFEWGSRARAAVEHDLDLRLPHPRGGRHRGAGARLHARRRLHLRRARHRARAGGRRLRAAALVLLGHPQRLLRGDRQAARRATHLGAPHEGALRREGPALVDDALPFPDGRRDAHGAAADEQHRARRVPGAWPRCSAARSRCTRTRWTRRSRSPPSTRCRWRCAPSRCSRSRAACRT